MRRASDRWSPVLPAIARRLWPVPRRSVTLRARGVLMTGGGVPNVSRSPSPFELRLVVLTTRRPEHPISWVLAVMAFWGNRRRSRLHLPSHGIATVGDVQSGLPPFGLPDVGLKDFRDLRASGSRIRARRVRRLDRDRAQFAQRHGYDVDANRELTALGSANIVGGLTAPSRSPPRTPAQPSMTRGARDRRWP